MESENPYVLIEGARAISLWGDPIHYSMLLQKYLLDIPPQAKDELSLSVARLLGLYDAFYSDLGMLHRQPCPVDSRMAGTIRITGWRGTDSCYLQERSTTRPP